MTAAVAPMRAAIKKRYFADPDSSLGGFDLAPLRPWFEALATGHPRMDDGASPRSREDIKTISEMAIQLADFANTAHSDRPPEVGLSAWLMTDFVRMALGVTDVGPLPAERYPEAHLFLFEHRRLRAEAREAAEFWWRERGGQSENALAVLLKQLEKELAPTSPNTLDVAILNRLWISLPQDLAQ